VCHLSINKPLFALFSHKKRNIQKQDTKKDKTIGVTLMT